MYPIILTLHSGFRWMVLAGLLAAVITAMWGVAGNRPFTTRANAIRHWAATLTEIQLVLGFVLYSLSPVTSIKAAGNNAVWLGNQQFFFSYVHAGLMFLAVVALSIGSAKAKRADTDRQKYQTMLRWYVLALLVILAAVPWPFSPLADRPYLRLF
ncbi:hypothetical protein [Dyadobacter sandarakinus]|uniref:Cytochrome B n=1 Tax=Dyadobacter sandarakinus TaxID=2747268 RepID=A0ABX7I729_9BACT|nr:hypothetical protein [Dyadobacter sandarakinus]QRR01287.1 hypothetical protein HWI92_10410 [Dyadobacter sandarakinus]